MAFGMLCRNVHMQGVHGQDIYIKRMNVYFRVAVKVSQHIQVNDRHCDGTSEHLKCMTPLQGSKMWLSEFVTIAVLLIHLLYDHDEV